MKVFSSECVRLIMHFDDHNPDNNLYYYKAYIYIDKQILTSASACEMNIYINTHYTQDFWKQNIYKRKPKP